MFKKHGKEDDELMKTSLALNGMGQVGAHPGGVAR
jgi:hypothetical protein